MGVGNYLLHPEIFLAKFRVLINFSCRAFGARGGVLQPLHELLAGRAPEGATDRSLAEDVACPERVVPDGPNIGLGNGQAGIELVRRAAREARVA